MLASRSTALQVVTLLNQLYGAMDSICSQYKVFKVETIGDAYIIASGTDISSIDCSIKIRFI